MIAHAVISRPRLLLLDEPLANLDLRSEQGIVSVLARLAREQQIAVLISAHDMNPLMRETGTVVYVAAGRAAAGRTDDVIRTEVLSALYGSHVDVLHVHGRVLVVAGDERGARPRRTVRWRSARPPTAGAERGGRLPALHRRARAAEQRPGAHRGPGRHRRRRHLGRGRACSPSSAASRSPGTRSPTSRTTGGAGAFLAGISQFWGFLIAGIAGAAIMELIGVQRRRGRDVATGVVLGAALGAAALFLYLGTLTSSTTGASFTILFGSMFVISPDTVPALIASGLLALVVVALLSRVLLLTALSPDIAAARGVRVRAVGVAYLVALAVAVSLSAVVIGAVLSTALLIGPAATVAAGHQAPGAGDGGRGADRHRRHLAGHPARLRQLLLAAAAAAAGRSASSWSPSSSSATCSPMPACPGAAGPARGQAARAPENQEAPACSPA